MKFTQPKLPYAPDALSPIISQRTIDYHWGKHTKAYIDTLNELILGTAYEDMPIEDIITHSNGKLFNQASQAWNHIFYFFQFSPEPVKEPRGKLYEQIEKQYGSLDELKKLIIEAGIGVFGSGWVWLSADDNGKLLITQGGNAANPMTDGLRPILTLDVWEHAYYLDYQNLRAEYLKKVWDLIDWDIIGIRYE
ncbi:MAG: superoxide dismutase [Muribaculaceae bacterium]|nr:superoxide dismutase [Muribaculaceae bacterium]